VCPPVVDDCIHPSIISVIIQPEKRIDRSWREYVIITRQCYEIMERKSTEGKALNELRDVEGGSW